MAIAVSNGMHHIPRDIDLVVGIPRSGLFAAWYISLSLNIRVIDLGGFLAGMIPINGRRPTSRDGDTVASASRRILLVDDSALGGASMAAARESIEEAFPDLEIVTLVVYALPNKPKVVDIALESCAQPRVFEWNICHSWIVERSCYDMDGVLCRDPRPDENDDGQAYLRFLSSAEPLVLPTGRIRKIVTSRLEKYRHPTEDWLARHGVSYDELIMLDVPTAEERRRLGNHGAFKADVFRADSQALLFIESETRQAALIAEESKKTVFDYGRREIVQPGRSSFIYKRERAAGLWRRAKRKLAREARAFADGIAGATAGRQKAGRVK